MLPYGGRMHVTRITSTLPVCVHWQRHSGGWETPQAQMIIRLLTLVPVCSLESHTCCGNIPQKTPSMACELPIVIMSLLAAQADEYQCGWAEFGPGLRKLTRISDELPCHNI